MTRSYHHLGIYSDLVDEAHRQQPVFPLAPPGEETQQRVRQVLGWCDRPETALDVHLEHTWLLGDPPGELTLEELSWSVGYGPRTHAWFFKPPGAAGPLPAVLALHDHSGFKFYGKEKIADGSAPPEDWLVNFRRPYYGGAWVNALAKEGFAVLVHDVFLWGSRKFPLEVMQSMITSHQPEADRVRARQASGFPDEVIEYDYLAGHHEHWVSKYCNVLGTSLPGVVCHEDRIALNYLASRPDVDPNRLGCLGLSGGGNRAGLLRATASNLKAAGIAGLMTTYAELLDHNMSHTWMLFPFGWSRYGDWPDLVACQAPAPLLVQYALDDTLFTVAGMQAAHARLAAHYKSTGHPEAYTGQFYPGPHRFDLEMQAAAFAWLKAALP